MQYRIRDLENFVMTSSCRTFNDAATKLGITQPSLSESIKRLEKDLNVLLFYRSRSGIQLTPMGRSTYEKAKNALNSILDVKQSVSPNQNESFPQIIVSCHPMVASYTLPRALKDLRKKIPNYKLVLRHDSSRVVQQWVQNGTADIAVVINPTRVPDLIIRKLGEDLIRIYSGRNGFDKTKVFCQQSIFQVQHILRKWKNAPSDLIESDNFGLIARLVEQNLGYGILPERVVKLMKLKLKADDSLPYFRDEIALIYRPEFGKLSYERNLIDSIISTFN